MVNDTLVSDSDSVIPIMYLVLRLEILRISCMSTPFFDTRLIGLEVSDLAQPIIGSGSQPYKGN